MEISLYRDLGIIDAGTERNVLPILDKLNVSDPISTLDFCDCGVDYPATSKIIDKVLSDLAKIKGKKQLTIVFDFKIADLALHKWFFVGSSFFKISEDSNDMKNEDFKTILDKELNNNLIFLIIEIRDGNNIVTKKLEYGCK